MTTTPQHRNRAPQQPPADLMAHAAALPPANRGIRRTQYTILKPVIVSLHAKGYNGREITDEIRRFPPWDTAPYRRVYDAVTYHIREHLTRK